MFAFCLVSLGKRERELMIANLFQLVSISVPARLAALRALVPGHTRACLVPRLTNTWVLDANNREKLKLANTDDLVSSS